MTASIARLDDERLIREGEAAVDLYNRDLKSARARIMPMARGLLAAKRKYPATQDFGDWLQTSSYREIGQTDRAALIKIGENDDFAAKFMRITILTSPESIWDAIRDLMPTSERSELDLTPEHAAETAPIAPPAPENLAILDSENSQNGIEQAPRPVPKSLLERAPFVRRGYPKAELVLGYMLGPNTRSVLARALPKKRPGLLWALLIESIETGAFGPPNDFDVSAPTIRLLLPWLSPAIARRLNLDLTKTGDQVIARDDVLPIVRANKALLADRPDKLVTLVFNHRAERENAARRAQMDEKMAAAVARLPANERPIVVFGVSLWPRVSNDHAFTFSYDELCHALWFSQFLLNNLPHDLQPASKAIQARHLIKYVTPMLKAPGWQVAVRQFLLAYENNPDGECRIPPPPVNFGM
jgi:hypothetical protein